MASTKATATDSTATDSTATVPTTTPAHTHVGRLGLRSYQSFDTYYHGDGYRMPIHAANVDKSPSAGAKLRYRTLCGKTLHPADGDQGTEFDGGVSEATEGSYISCKRCRRIIKGKGMGR
jgi:hypothetical protein